MPRPPAARSRPDEAAVGPAATDPATAPDLRRRILDTGRALLEARGPAALSLREVARLAGVTHQAPYHHFANREAILAELVGQGFDELASALAAANGRVAVVGPRAGVVESGLAYVGFALAHPGLFRIMFRHDMCDPAHAPAARAAGERAYGELLRLVELVHGAAGDELAALYWAQVHGLAGLLIDGPLGAAPTDVAARLAQARAVLQHFADAVAPAR